MTRELTGVCQRNSAVKVGDGERVLASADGGLANAFEDGIGTEGVELLLVPDGVHGVLDELAVLTVHLVAGHAL